MDPDLRFALDLADGADAITLAHFRSTGLGVEVKPDDTPVSVADRLVEQYLRARITAERPGDAIVGEEFGALEPYGSSDGAAGGATPARSDAVTTSDGSDAEGPGGGRRWILDPIDGTKNYIRGMPVFATLIALDVAEAVRVGVVSAPALGRRWWASRSAGAYASDALGSAPAGTATTLRVSGVEKLSDAYLSCVGLDEQDRPDFDSSVLELAASCWSMRGFGDFWGHMLVAEGVVDAAVEPSLRWWDYAALQVIVEEAGGVITGLAGEPVHDGGGAVSSNGLVHARALEMLAV